MSKENNLDNFDPNNHLDDDRDKNDFFRRGGYQYSGNSRGNYGGGRRYDDRDRRGGDIPRFHNGGPHYGGGGYNRGYRDRDYRDRDYRDNNSSFRGRGSNRGFYRNDYGRGYNTDRRYDNYYNSNPNYENRDYQRENINRENDEEREIQMEKEKLLNEFKKKYGEIIEAFKVLFVNESLKEEQIIDILHNIKATPNLTIFEAMNSIYRQVQIIKTLGLDNSNRQYGPNSDRLDFEFDQQKLNKKNLEKVIKEYKVYKLEENDNEENINDIQNENEKYWYYIDDFDKRRKLIKDEEGYFNYVPLMNPSGESNKEDDIYAKNENEISYHALYYKTIMCKECDINNNTNEINIDLCPYAHDILKDFRIIYKYTDEEVCKFMILLQKSNLFSFKNYLNYIPMSLKGEFNIDTFKAHKCQLDDACPNDYHICPYYHPSEKVDEQRRPPTLFGYTGSSGDLCFNQRKKVYCADKCPCGIFCRYVHNKNEFNYHQDHFRKEFNCTRKKNKYGKCVYLNTCYGKHPKEEYNKIDIEEKEEEVDLDNIENDDEEIEDMKNKENNIIKIAKAFRCRKCQNVESNICYFIKCVHFICLKCYKKLYKESKKNNKKNKDEEKKDKKDKNEIKSILCPFCDKEINSKEIVKAEF